MNKIDHAARVAVYEKAISQNGMQLQMVVAVEELSEAQKEICKFLRGCGDIEHLAEEIADAAIMLEQLRYMFGIYASISSYMDAKVQRLAERLAACNNTNLEGET